MPRSLPCHLAVLTFGVLALPSRGASDPNAAASPPREQLQKFHVPPGFEVQLVASEPEIQKPINLNFDAAGRLWATGSQLYPWPAKRDANGQPIAAFDKNWDDAAKQFRVGDKAPQPTELGKDTVRILSEFGTDGRARKIGTFADGLNIPTGIQPLPRLAGAPRASEGTVQAGSAAEVQAIRASAKGDSAIVFSIPNIWMMTDVDGDGRADRKVPLYEGFGFKDTHGMSSNYLYWIDGWIYGCHGFSNHSEVRDRAGNVTVFDSGNTYRFKPDGSKIEYYTHGQTNPFGLTVDPLGNFYSADSHSKPVYMLLRGGFYEGIGKQHDGLGFAPRITDDDHGSSAIAGIAYYADDKFPEEFRGNLFNGNPVTQKINRDRLEWQGSTPKAIRMSDFLTCDDPWFRPVQVKLGPDGALWIADFYNPIIGHYESPLTDPRRDNQHGRIWRVVWKGDPAAKDAAAGSLPNSQVDAVQSNRASAKSASRSVPGATPATALESIAPPSDQGAATVAAWGNVAPDLMQLNAAALVAKLADPNLILRTLATNELVERLGEEAIKPLQALHDSETNRLQLVKDSAVTSSTDPRKTVADAGAKGNSALQLAHGLWALDRLGAVHTRRIQDLMFESDTAFRVHVAKSMAERARRVREGGARSPNDNRLTFFSAIGGEDAVDTENAMSALSPDSHEPIRNRTPAAQRAAAEAIATFPASAPFDRSIYLDLLRAAAEGPDNDTELRYAARVALREHLTQNGTYGRLAELLRAQRGGLDEKLSSLVADVSLGVPTPEAADFLLAHLRRTNLVTPRAGEFLRHAVLHIVPERLREIGGIVEELGNVPLTQRLAMADGLGEAVRKRGLELPENVNGWVQRVMTEALSTSDPALLDRAIAAVREAMLEQKFEPLRVLVLKAGEHGPRRAAALDALMNLPRGREVAATALVDPSSMTLRKRAAELLGQSNGHEARAVLLGALPTAPWELALSIAAGLSKSDAGCEQLLAMLENGKASPALLRNQAVAGPLGSRPQPLRDRAARLTAGLPPEDARLDGVIAQRVNDFRAAQPNAAHGAQLFEQQCAVCHKVKSQGGNIGPNLDGLAARGVHRVVEDILDPNRNVDPGFRQTLIETADGQTVAGVNLREEGPALLLSDATGKDIMVLKNVVKSQSQSRLSLMPPIFETLLSAGDLSDLLAFLLGP